MTRSGPGIPSDGHATDDLQSITAVPLGGTSLLGRVATIVGTVVGVWIPAVLQIPA